MNCLFDYCIYNKDSACILDEIQIDTLGNCENCETVFISKEVLEINKRIRLQEKEERHLRFKQ